ncbi:DegT/DnrJ/EryC1/StrS family aminotransferase [Novipirellula artificiosorum]|uniref:dTDP-3-amino-3,6-dideoxy-alpha-D-galactopyranose transaminase n=1 Tax=Novipirellula artificiosorum TaxID=2528016 RepID=A0A5C6DCD2_9BACT|nr:DegT/DnrJ/EryC1/StrS family aminotransferase [Novipirellula artificiosorum]TWU32599.1 dTDP-3-amino-3,6-dideoxy-alpha-D-galactopyranose transaminase [Novipirellula artificiosorum]
MDVPFLELKPAYLELKSEFDAAYHRVMESGWYLLGAEVKAFESEYAAYCETDHCVGVANGLEAIKLALLAADVGPGDEVVVPAHTFIATWLAVSSVGATIVPVEPDPVTLNIDTDLIAPVITSKTKAIIPVHLYGQPAHMAPIMEIAVEHDLVVIEDAAQAQGATYKGRRVGSLGHLAAHSFYPGKNLGAFADGGAVTTSDPGLAERVRMLGNYGSRQKYNHEIVGTNSRLSELQAAFLRVRLSVLDQWNDRRREQAAQYTRELAACANIALPQPRTDTNPVWHLYVIQTDHRDELQKHLSDSGIGTVIHYPIPCHRSGAYRELGFNEFPITENISKRCLSLPIGPHARDPVKVANMIIRFQPGNAASV